MLSFNKALFFNQTNVSNSTVLLCAFFVGACLPLCQSQLISIPMLIGIAVFVFILNIIFRDQWQVLFIFSAGVLGLCWTTVAFQGQSHKVLPVELEQVDLLVVGSVEGLPVSRDDNTGFIIRVEASDAIGLKPDSLLKLNCYRCALDFEPSQRWQLTLRLKRPHGYASWGAFDYEKYLFRHQIVAKGYVRNKGYNQRLTDVNWSFDQWRWSLAKKLKSNGEFSNIGLAVILALTIGDKTLINPEQTQVFQDTGVSHLMAISGLHVGLVFLSMSYLCAWLSYPFARIYTKCPRQHIVLIPALLSAFLYSAMAGFSVSTVRALIMLLVFVLCRLLVREVSLHKVLLVAACIILVIDPFSTLDVGFWLSCGAVFIIAGFANSTNSLSLLRLQPLLWLGMLPLSALFFSQASLVSPIVNLIAVPLFCFLLIPLTLLSLVILILGLEQVAWHLFSYLDIFYVLIFDVLQWLSGLEFAKLATGPLSLLHVILLVLALICFYFKAIVVSVFLWSVMIFFLFFPISNFFNTQQKAKLTVSLLDVGQGLSMVIQVSGSENYTLIYDTGPRYASGFSAAKAVVIPFLRNRGIKKIDRLIVSHADNDHIGGYEDIVNTIDVSDVLTSRTDVLNDAILCQSGQSWQIDEVRFEILSPDSSTPEGSNNLSCVLRVSYGLNTVLLTGDIESSAEHYLVDTQSNLTAQILVAGHHGSKTSSSQRFIDAVQPELVLISAGYLNRYKHPHKKVLDRYSDRNVELASTVDNGSVIITINKQGWRKLAYRNVNRAFWHHQKKPN